MNPSAIPSRMSPKLFIPETTTATKNANGIKPPIVDDISFVVRGCSPLYVSFLFIMGIFIVCNLKYLGGLDQ